MTCRICHEWMADVDGLRIGRRYNVHIECGLKRYGAALFRRLPDYQIQAFPFWAAQRAGLIEALRTEHERRALATADKPACPGRFLRAAGLDDLTVPED